jgi:hypothetical protein
LKLDVPLKGFLAAVAIAVAGCATITGRPPEAVVKERSQARWDALVNGNFEAAYGYLSPGSRAVQSQADYVTSLGKGFWKSAKVDKVMCQSEQACDVELTIEYEFRGHRTKTPLRETWVREGSEWWYVKK